ncbi:MAG: MBL fold metallo-hydrolase [Acidobacteria bacterium]|nr:MBL fold metallo-hydrolase [Acidobacteriota bacterium]MBI3471248.1 MBL fold metallo-hydrolase [Candidatus Solibacter usitatus]
MPRVLFASLFLALLAGAFLREASSQSNFTQPLAPDVYWRAADRDKRIIANAGWVVFRDYVLVIDANYPWGARAILDDIRKTTSKPIRYVFDTHYHADHAFGNSLFVDAGATIVCTEECVAESRKKNVPAWEKASASSPADYQGQRLEHPQVGFRDKLVFDDGQHRVELLRLGPGHTRGDAVAYLPKEKILFTGDLCVNFAGNNVADPDADPDNWLRALDAMSQMDVGRLIPGHGAQGSAETLRGQRAYLAAMIHGVRAGLEKGLTADQLVSQIDLSAHKPWGQDATRNAGSIRAIYAKLKR